MGFNTFCSAYFQAKRRFLAAAGTIAISGSTTCVDCTAMSRIPVSKLPLCALAIASLTLPARLFIANRQPKRYAEAAWESLRKSAHCLDDKVTVAARKSKRSW